MDDQAVKIDGVPVTAPLWGRAPAEDLARIMKLMLDASYHYADDTAREWSRGNRCMIEAAQIANQHKLSFGAIKSLHSEAKPIMPLSDWANSVLRDARDPKGSADILTAYRKATGAA